MILKELCATKSYIQTCKMICVHAIASDGRRNRGVNNTLISQLVEMVAQKINVEQGQEVQDQSEPPDDAALTLANLTRVSPDVWKELPKDVQDVHTKLLLWLVA